MNRIGILLFYMLLHQVPPLDELIGNLGSGKEDRVRVAAYRLGQLGSRGSSAAPAVLEALANAKGQELVIVLLETLGSLGVSTDEVCGILEQHLDHEVRSVSLVAATSLLRLDCHIAAATECLVSLGGVEDSLIRSSAQAALVSNNRDIDMLLTDIEHPDPRVRQFVAETLGELRDCADAATVLAVAASEDPVDPVRHRSLWALSAYGDAAIPSLQAALQDPRDAAAAERGFLRLGPAAMSPLRKLAESKGSAATRARDVLEEIERLIAPGMSWSPWHTRDGLALQIGTDPPLVLPGETLHISIRLLNISDAPLAIRRHFEWEASGARFAIHPIDRGIATSMLPSSSLVRRPDKSSFTVLSAGGMAAGERWFPLVCQPVHTPSPWADCDGLPAILNGQRPTCVAPGAYKVFVSLSNWLVDHPSHPSARDFEEALSARMWMASWFTSGETTVSFGGCESQ